mmetsp:Transcript_11961/g.36441  ORF Transcript_11961/g.36441 Transcript_11961/m.36441 type:complete len:320 (-) Transcript_11961:156-1115(-)
MPMDMLRVCTAEDRTARTARRTRADLERESTTNTAAKRTRLGRWVRCMPTLERTMSRTDVDAVRCARPLLRSVTPAPASRVSSSTLGLSPQLISSRSDSRRELSSMAPAKLLAAAAPWSGNRTLFTYASTVSRHCCGELHLRPSPPSQNWKSSSASCSSSKVTHRLNEIHISSNRRAARAFVSRAICTASSCLPSSTRHCISTHAALAATTASSSELPRLPLTSREISSALRKRPRTTQSTAWSICSIQTGQPSALFLSTLKLIPMLRPAMAPPVSRTSYHWCDTSPFTRRPAPPRQARASSRHLRPRGREGGDHLAHT